MRPFSKLIAISLIGSLFSSISTQASWMEAFREGAVKKLPGTIVNVPRPSVYSQKTLFDYGAPFKASLHTLSTPQPALHVYRQKPTPFLFKHEIPFKAAFLRHYSTDTTHHYFDPKNNVAFKKLFGAEEHKPLLIDFLNNVLHLHEPRLIRTVELLSTKQIPHIKTATRSILDVRCTDQRNFQYIMAIQNRKVPNFIKYSQYYSDYIANIYIKQLESNKYYVELNPVILLTITDQDLFPKKIGYISYRKTLDTETYEHDLQDLSYAFIELSKFTKTEEELKTNEDHWLYMFKHADKIKEMPKSSPKELQEAYKTLEEFNWTSEEKVAYGRENTALLDEFDALRSALNKGRTEGKAEEKKEIAFKMLNQGMPYEEIRRFTGFSIEELKHLEEELLEEELKGGVK